MSTIREVAKTVQKLTPRERGFLRYLASLTRTFSIIPYSVLQRRLDIDSGDLEFILKRLHNYKFIQRTGFGVRLLSAGLDAIALDSLRRRGILESLGPAIAVGKESDVYEGLSPSGEPLAVKFFRIGRISFRGIKRGRGYVSDEIHEWHIINVKSARREFDVLSEVSEKGCPVPIPVDRAFHVLVMKEYLAIPLFKMKELKDPGEVYRRVLGALRCCVCKAGYVHADLSEFNVLVDEDENVLIIDWPQAVKFGDPSSEEKLRRDVHNITRYFTRKYRLEVDEDEALHFVKGCF